MDCTHCQKDKERGRSRFVFRDGALVDFCPHSAAKAYVPFKGYFDIGLGMQIDSLADRRRAMRQTGMDYRGVKPGMPRCEV